MEALEAILSRRSIRRYKTEPVSESLVTKLLQAGMSAPSAGNQQPWGFVVIRDRGILDAIPTFHPFAEMLRLASVAILVCGDERVEQYSRNWVLDCSAATQNILLAAHALGLGAVWLGIYPDQTRMEGIHRLVGLPDQVHPLSLIPVGYPAEDLTIVDRFKPERIHHDRW